MMPTIQEIRKMYPQYNDLPDHDLANSLHAKFYSDIPIDEFNAKIGLSAESIQQEEEKGFIDRVGENVKRRADLIINPAPNSTPYIDPVISAARLGVGTASDIGTELVKSAYGALPDKLTNAIESGVSSVIPEGVKGYAKSVSDKLPAFVEKHPTFSNIVGLATEAPVGAVVAKGAEKAVKSTLAARRAAKAEKSLVSSDIKAMSTNAYKEAAEKGGVLNEEWTNSFIDELQIHKPRPIGGKVFTSEQKKLMDSISEYEGLRDTRLSLEDIQNLDETLGDKVTLNPQTGRPDKAGFKILELQDKLREMVLNAPEAQVLGEKSGFEALDKARKLWSASRASEDIERIIERASMMDNEATAMKTGFRTLSMNKSRMSGYTPEEQALIKKAAKGQPVADLLRTTIGSRLISTVGGFAGGGLTGAAAGAAAGMAARGGASALQLRKAQKILGEINKRATKASGKGK